MSGGVVDLSGAQAITGGATRITADGGTVDLSAATQFADTNGNVLSWLRSLNGGAVDFGTNTVQLSAVTTTLNETGNLTAGTLELGPSAVLDGVGPLDASLVIFTILSMVLSTYQSGKPWCHRLGTFPVWLVFRSSWLLILDPSHHVWLDISHNRLAFGSPLFNIFVKENKEPPRFPGGSFCSSEGCLTL